MEACPDQSAGEGSRGGKNSYFSDWTSHYPPKNIDFHGAFCAQCCQRPSLHDKEWERVCCPHTQKLHLKWPKTFSYLFKLRFKCILKSFSLKLKILYQLLLKICFNTQGGPFFSPCFLEQTADDAWKSETYSFFFLVMTCKRNYCGGGSTAAGGAP